MNPKNLNKCGPSNDGNVGKAIYCLSQSIKELEKFSGNTEYQLDNERFRALNAENLLQQHINEEFERASAEEFQLNNNLNGEIDRATNSETTLDNKITDLIEEINTKTTQLHTLLTNEISRASEKETEINSALITETNRATETESILQENINAEVTRAENVETELLSTIESEEHRAQNAEQVLDNKIESEETRAIAAERILLENIDAEKTRAEQVENMISSNLTEEIAARKQAITNVINSIPEAQILPDWNLSDVNAKDYIKNKPHALDGKSAYELAIDNGFSGSLSDWLVSLKGSDGQNGVAGQDGKSTYQIYLDNTSDNPKLSEADWLLSLKGELGIQGEPGSKGPKGDTGEQGILGPAGQNGSNGQDGHTPVITASKSNGVTTVSVDGTAIATINDGVDGNNISTSPYLSFAPKEVTGSNYTYIDLGLPSGTLWATKNIGATDEYDDGLYFSYANVYGYSNPSTSIFSLSNYESTPGYALSGGDIPTNTSFDAARYNMGTPWRIPTSQEFEELFNNTDITWVANSYVKFTSRQDHSIYIIIPNILDFNYSYDVNSSNSRGYARYWCSNSGSFFRAVNNNYPSDTDYHSCDTYSTAKRLYDGYCIRGVISPNATEEIIAQHYHSVPAAKVAITGDYNDLINKPTILTIPDTSIYLKRPALDANNYTYVDLGLPSGTMWATMNVGASTETDYGNYYRYGKGSEQYANDASQSSYTGTENPLSFTADTARQVMGGDWHMPTVELASELLNNTTITDTYINSVHCVKITGPNNNYIYIPYAGFYEQGNLLHTGDFCALLTSSPTSNNNNGAYVLEFDYSQNVNMTYGASRYNGCSVRPVIDGFLTASKVAATGSYNDLTNKPSVPIIWRGTQAQYDAITNPDSNTIYIITSAS